MAVSMAQASSVIVKGSFFFGGCKVDGPDLRGLKVLHSKRPSWICSSETASTSATASGKDIEKVLIFGATGGVGQLVAASLLQRGVPIRAFVRDEARARQVFSRASPGPLEIMTGDLRSASTLRPSVFEGVSHIVCTTGTTAFPSKRWEGGRNSPEQADGVALRNLVAAIPPSPQFRRLVLVSSIGVLRSGQLPFSILNLFGVLKYKKQAEDLIMASGLPFTILRAARLTDGPYTSLDLNTLLQATAGGRQQVVVGKGDTFTGEVSRLAVAEACVQALLCDCTAGQTYELMSVEGQGPGMDTQLWEQLFVGAGAT